MWRSTGSESGDLETTFGTPTLRRKDGYNHMELSAWGSWSVRDSTRKAWMGSMTYGERVRVYAQVIAMAIREGCTYGKYGGSRQYTMPPFPGWPTSGR